MIGRTNSAGVMPVGTINITENGTYAVGPYSEAVVSVSGLVPSGTLEISSNGTYDVTNYASASVNVQAGSFPYADLDLLIASTGSVYSGYCPSVIASYFMSGNSTVTTFTPYFSSNWDYVTINYYAFYGCSNLTEFPLLSSTAYKRVSFLGGLSNYSGALINFDPIISTAGSVSLVIQGLPKASLFSTYFTTNRTTYLSFGNVGCSKISVNCSAPNWIILKIQQCSLLTDLSFTNTGRLIFSGMYGITETSSLSQIHLTSVYLQNASWTFISNYALEKIHLDCINTPYVSFRWFQNCYKLSSVEFYYGGSLYTNAIELKSYAFQNCSALTEFPFKLYLGYNSAGIFMGAGIKSIYSDDSKFVNQTTFTSSCFQSCLSLKYVSYPRATVLSSSAFYGCTALSYVNFWGHGCSLQRIFGSAFYGCSALGSIMFGMDTSFYGGNCQIYPGAFMNCTSLSKVYIPHWSQASNIHGLQNVNAFENTPLSDSTYLGYYGSIYVPESLYSSYITATNWAAYSERFVSVTEAEMEQIIADYNNVSYVEE